MPARARAEALADGKARAETLAAQLGLALGRVLVVEDLGTVTVNDARSRLHAPYDRKTVSRIGLTFAARPALPAPNAMVEAAASARAGEGTAGPSGAAVAGMEDLSEPRPDAGGTRAAVSLRAVMVGSA